MERLIRRWLHPIDPIYRREFAHVQPVRIPHIGYISTIIFYFMCCFSSGAVLLLVVSILRLWVVVSTSDAIAYEVENGTWTTLRMIPCSTRELVKTKYAGALVRARILSYILVVLRIVVTPIIFAISYLLLSANTNTYNTTNTLVDVDTSLFLSTFVFIVLDTVLDFITDGALGIVASAFARTPGHAMALAFGLGVAGMFAQYLTLFFLPLSLFLSLSPTQTSCYTAMLAIIALRYAIVRGLLALAVWRAERIQ